MRFWGAVSAITMWLAAAAAAIAQEDPVRQVLGAGGGAKIEALAFSRSGTEVIAHYADGRILAWSMADETDRTVAQTEGAFAYCAPLDRLLIATPKTAVLLSLTDGDYATLSEGFYDHAAFSADCQTLALSEAASRTVELWTLHGSAKLKAAATLGLVSNGLALSPDGKILGAATDALIGSDGEDTALEIFADPTAKRLARVSLVLDEASALGKKALAVTPSGMIVTGTHNAGQAGLRAIDMDGKTLWDWSNLDGAWITGILVIAERGAIVTADDAGAVTIWHLDTGTHVAEAQAPAPISAIAASQDGRMLAIARQSGDIEIVDIDAILKSSR